MTTEEYESLPACLKYTNPGKSNGCRHHPNNNDDWDELIDPCENCSHWKYNRRDDEFGKIIRWMQLNRENNEM